MITSLKQLCLGSFFIAVSFGVVNPLSAQTALPGPADAGRIDPLAEEWRIPSARPRVATPDAPPEMTAPEGAEDITFILKDVRVEGVKAFAAEELAPLYEHYIGEEITLDKAWLFAEQITQYYRDKGYFLSRAYVPAQEIEEGVIIIRVVEGYIGTIEWQGNAPDNAIIQSLTREIETQRPIKADVLESALLYLNDLPGKRFRAIVQAVENGEEGEAGLLLIEEREKGRGIVRFDNAGSRFLGPHQLSAFYEDSFLPMQSTLIGASTTVPWDEMQYVTLQHTVSITARTKAKVSGSYVHTEPGSTLSANDIESRSAQVDVGMEWQPVRQWLENLTLGMRFSGHNVNSDIFGLELTRDKIRALRADVTYDIADFWGGHSFWHGTLSRGIPSFGSSRKGDLDLSRADARPDFTSLTFSYTRYQPVKDDVLLIGRFASQWASGGLFSAEEFGFGGRMFGRAYDPSELTGDHGIAFSLEGRYTSLPLIRNTQATPFVYYDIGKVWNEDVSGDFSASSAGFGLILSAHSGITGTFTAAFPLTREINHPLYGTSEHGPRFMFDLTYAF